MRDRILHLADLHLGDRHGYLGDEAVARRAEADAILERIVDRVLEGGSRVGGVLIAGDLFDHYEPEGTLVEQVLAQLGRLEEARIPVVTVPGNHDELSYPTCVYRVHGGRWPGVLVTRADPGRVGTWSLGGRKVDIYAMAFVAGRSRPPFDRPEIEDPTAFNLAVYHGSLDLPSGDRSVPLSSRNLEAAGLHYVALGHVHTPSDRRLGRGRAAYPGRIVGGGFHDPGGAPLLEVEVTAEGPKLWRTEVLSRPIETLEVPVSDCACEADLDARLERLAAPPVVDPTGGSLRTVDGGPGRGVASEKRIVRLRLRGVPGFPLDGESIRRRWSPRFRHLELDLRPEDAGLPDLEGVAREATVRGRFVRIALERIRSLDDGQERRIAEIALREGLAAFGSASRP